jgi:2-iminobutanoate/2-iminopropanoate deaminase
MTARLVVEAPPAHAMAAPVGHYAHATVLNGQVFVSGLLALAEDGSLVGKGDAGAQARFIFETLARILRAAGSELGHVAKLNLYLLNLDDRAAVNAARRDAFGDWRPASTLVQVAGLIGEGTLLEIEAIAAIATPPEKNSP